MTSDRISAANLLQKQIKLVRLAEIHAG